MKRPMKWTLTILILFLVITLAAAAWYIARAVPIGTGYAAKYLCSSVFISERNPGEVFRKDIEPVNSLAGVIDAEIDYEKKSATATALGVFKSVAVYRKGCGCTLVAGTTGEDLQAQAIPDSGSAPPPESRASTIFRHSRSGGPFLPEGVDHKAISKALDRHFEEPMPGEKRQTRAVVILYDGRVIAERYAAGFNRDMPLLGWSMSKSVTNALAGILVGKGVLDLNEPAPVPEWDDPRDPRRGITLGNLVQMSSGLAFEEIYKPLYDVTRMLYRSHDFAAYAAGKPLEAPPGTRWRYSSGTANIVARIIRHKLEQMNDHPVSFARKELFHRVGMESAVLELDPSGTFVGSSYTFATARDWSRFGLLYLNDGCWQGERILPEGWVNFSTTPAENAPQGKYGAFFWLNRGSKSNPRDRMWPALPRDAYCARGFQGQRLVIIPSKKLVVVRMGLTLAIEALGIESFLRDIVRSLPDSAGTKG